MNAEFMPRDTVVPPILFDVQGRIALQSSENFPHGAGLRLWCHIHARYGGVTAELIDWLRTEIRSRKAIEIGAGSGDLCGHLGIPGTDNHLQTSEAMKAYYKMIGQPLITYPPWVEEMDARTAIEWYKPDIVVAQWVTEYCDPNLPAPEYGGSIYGIHENEIVDAGITYILIGNQSVHGHKKIMKEPHMELNFPWLRSRSSKTGQDRIWVWNV